MTIELPKDVKGREIPLDTTKLFGANGNVYNIRSEEHTSELQSP